MDDNRKKVMVRFENSKQEIVTVIIDAPNDSGLFNAESNYDARQRLVQFICDSGNTAKLEIDSFKIKMTN